MATKSGEAFFRAATLASCRVVSIPRGFMQSAAPMIGEMAQPVAGSIARSGSAVVVTGGGVVTGASETGGCDACRGKKMSLSRKLFPSREPRRSLQNFSLGSRFFGDAQRSHARRSSAQRRGAFFSGRRRRDRLLAKRVMGVSATLSSMIFSGQALRSRDHHWRMDETYVKTKQPSGISLWRCRQDCIDLGLSFAPNGMSRSRKRFSLGRSRTKLQHRVQSS